MEEGIKIRNMLVLDEDRRKTIKMDGENFIIKALLPKDRSVVARRIAISQNGLASNAFSDSDIYNFRRNATVDQCIHESPPWWSEANACPEDRVLDKLFDEIDIWTIAFQEKLKKNKLTGGGKTS